VQQFDDYQKFTEVTVSYPEDSAIGYTVMGLIGETGEYAEKIMDLTDQVSKVQPDEEEAFQELKEILAQAIEVGHRAEVLKKQLRARKARIPNIIIWGSDQRDNLQKEMGDVLWYCTRATCALGMKLSEVVDNNVSKLISRLKRGVIQGEGDNR